VSAESVIRSTFDPVGRSWQLVRIEQRKERPPATDLRRLSISGCLFPTSFDQCNGARITRKRILLSPSYRFYPTELMTGARRWNLIAWPISSSQATGKASRRA
jgi:hypothetical protein